MCRIRADEFGVLYLSDGPGSATTGGAARLTEDFDVCGPSSLVVGDAVDNAED